ncbi:dual specificity protein kinase TTK-like isoform X2 [Branchiostoma lanceolatum]|uniref:dual specificity protein kinase TTK-like isoform X2 n=1 Tax=Branchiostoma lanceolatum TaxID=7740 RepID=UPI0034566587
MSRLKSLQSRLQSIYSRDEKDDTNNTGNLTGTGTYNLTDHTSWIDRISAAGNKPSDWLEFLTQAQGRTSFSSPQARYTYLLAVYDKALHHMPVELCRRDESYAKILIQLAHIKRDHNEEDGQTGFKFARVNAKTFAFVHVAAAQFELSRAREEKAQSILQKGLDVGAEPTEMLNTALIRLGNKEKLLMEDKENVWDSVQPSFSAAKPKGPALTKQQPPQNQTTVDPSPSLVSTDSTIVFQKQGGCRNDSGGSSSLDENDTLPLLWGHREKPPQLSRSTWSASKLSGRELHTPQSQTQRVVTSHTEGPNANKRQPARVPLRVKRSSLPKLREMSKEDADDDDSDDTDCFLGVKPLKNISPPTEGMDTLAARAKPPLPFTGRKVSPESNTNTTNDSKTFKGLSLCKFSKSSSLLSHTTPRAQMLAKETSPTENTASSKPTEPLRETSKAPLVSNPGHHSTHTNPITDSARKAQSISPTSTVVSFPERQPPCAKVPSASDTADAATVAFNSMQVPGALASHMHIPPVSSNLPPGNKTIEHLPSQHAHLAPKMLDSLKSVVPEVRSNSLHTVGISHEVSGGQGSVQLGTRSGPATGPTVVPKNSQMPTPNIVNQNTMPGFFTPSASLPGAQQHVQQPHSQHFQQVAPPPQPQFATPRMPCAPTERSDVICVKGKPFRILSIIGKGGSSKVYQVYDEKGKVYALKLVNLEEGDETTVQGYINEITHLSNLQHSPRVIKLYDFEVTDERIVLVMEKGSVDLATFLRNKKKQQGSIADDVLWFYWRHMLEAVDTIHRQGIVHSDLKPANFLFVDGDLKLIDFGIANAIQSDKTSVIKDQQVGTLNYMSPETIREYNPAQYRDGNSKKLFKINCRSDVWSLGCILYYMVYGKTPFQHIPNHFAKLQAIVDPNYEIQFPPIKNHLLLDMLKKCLIRDPYNRPSTADLLAHPYLNSERSSGAKEQPCPAAPALPMTADQIQQLLTQLNQAQSMSPNSISTVSKGLAAQLQSGQAPDLSAVLKKRQGPSQDKENLPPQHLLRKGPGCTLQHALPRPPSEHTLGRP